jgi:hypothetical protein
VLIEVNEAALSADSFHFAGVVLITVPAIAFWGVRLLSMIFRREPPAWRSASVR